MKPDLNPCEWQEQELNRLTAERDRLAAENGALCAFVEALDGERDPCISNWVSAECREATEVVDAARAAIEPILAARRERG